MGIQVHHISKFYGQQKAVDDISFEVSTGELVSFLGPNGAGKSTIMKMITGYLSPDAGEVLVNGEIMLPDKTSIRRQIGYLPEHNPLYPDLYIREYLDICAGFYQLRNKKKRIDEMIEMTGLGDERQKKIGALSKGYRQRVGLAQALIHDPSVLILDEPTTGLDPNQLDEIRTLIKTISRDKTVLFSTHIMQEVEAVCQRVLILNKGQLAADNRVDLLKLGKTGQKAHAQTVLVEFAGIPELKIFQGQAWIKSVKGTAKSSFLIESAVEEDIRPLIFRFAVEKNLILLTLQEHRQSLENVFRELTAKP